MMRLRARGTQRVFYRRNPGDRDLTPEMLASPEARKALISRMMVVTSDLPGTVGERMSMRADLERMVDQIEAETAAMGENGGQGRLPAYFATFTCAVYKWHQLHEMIESLLPPEEKAARKPFAQLTEEEKRERFYKDSLNNPGVVSWYCAIKLEMMVHLAVATIGRQLRGYRFDPEDYRPSQLDEELLPFARSQLKELAQKSTKKPRGWKHRIWR